MVTDFGKFCRKLRIDNDEIMKDMAKKLEVTPSYLSAIEKGKRTIPTDWAEQIANHYELSKQQISELTNIFVIDSLSERERSALEPAVSAIYFTDSSDYLSGLWDVVSAIVGNNIVRNEGFDIRGLYDLLNTED